MNQGSVLASEFVLDAKDKMVHKKMPYPREAHSPWERQMLKRWLEFQFQYLWIKSFPFEVIRCRKWRGQSLRLRADKGDIVNGRVEMETFLSQRWERERAKKQGNSLRRERSGDVYQVGSQKGSAWSYHGQSIDFSLVQEWGSWDSSMQPSFSTLQAILN